MKNNKSEIKLFLARQLYTLYEPKVFQIWDHFFPLLFPKDYKNEKSLDIGLWEVGAKIALNGVRNTNTKKILLSKARFAQKLTYFSVAILHPLLVKNVKLDTTSFHYFAPRILNL